MQISRHIPNPVKYLSWIILFRIMCGPSIFKTLAYSESKYCQQNQHTHNTVKHLSWNILFTFLCNPDILRTLLYSPLWYILKNNHIQNPIEYLRWSILLRTLCNYSIFRRPIYSNHSLIEFVSYSLIHFMPLVSFYTSWKHQKISGFLMFLGGIERDHWHEMD